MTVPHFLQDCVTHQNLKAAAWPADTPMKENILDSCEVYSAPYTFSRPLEFLSQCSMKKMWASFSLFDIATKQFTTKAINIYQND